MPIVTRLQLLKPRPRPTFPRLNRKLTRSHDSAATANLDAALQSIRVFRKPQPRKTFKRRFVLLWKRLTNPSRPRASRRFSFMPPDFDLVSHDRYSRRESRRKSKISEAMTVVVPETAADSPTKGDIATTANSLQTPDS
ncbi:hypothetical protein R3P38DRAFT_2929816 [Favolaschia claudopus]|uniref:Uncharacterized protein n=1 Tax=Favolaschia claudopus TaxID=2862362 RepID=A0AAW0BVA5_9AGAR